MSARRSRRRCRRIRRNGRRRRRIRPRIAGGAAAQRVDRIRWRSVSPRPARADGGTQCRHRCRGPADAIPAMVPSRRRADSGDATAGPGHVRAHRVDQRVKLALGRTPHVPSAPGSPDDRQRRRSGTQGNPDRRRGRRAALLLVVSGVSSYVIGDTAAVGKPGPSTDRRSAAEWQPIADARVARDAVAATEADGTIWVFGGMGADDRVSGRHEGYDPGIDSWKGGDDLPVPVQHAMSVTWQGTPVVLGGWRTEGAIQGCDGPGLAGGQQSLDGVAASVAAPGGSGGRRGRRPHHRHRWCGRRRRAVEHDRDLRRQHLEAWRAHSDSATDVGRGVRRQAGVRRWRNKGTSDLAAVEAYDPAADRWTSLPQLPSHAATSAWHHRWAAGGGGGQAAGEVSRASALDLATVTWDGLPDMGTARHALAVAAVGSLCMPSAGRPVSPTTKSRRRRRR